MTSENAILQKSYEAAADLSSSQYFVVSLDASGDIVLADVAAVPIGILQNDPESGDTGTVMQVGESRAVAGAAITIEAAVASDANGKLRTAVASDIPVGRALEAASADGDIIKILINISGIAVA
jgi:hypothetical protein